MIKHSNEDHERENFSEVFLPEDMPFDSKPKESNTGNPSLAEISDFSKDSPVKEWEDSRKFALGSSMLGWCLFLMFLCILVSIWKPDNELVKSGFEAFKLIVMTILGYIFGSNNAKSK